MGARMANEKSVHQAPEKRQAIVKLGRANCSKPGAAGCDRRYGYVLSLHAMAHMV